MPPVPRSFRPQALLAGLWVGIMAFVASSACSLTVDVDGLENRDCPSGQKLCNDECVSVNDSKFGCTDTGCTPCRLAYATAVCSQGQCRVSSCTAPHQDCDGDSSNGCEVDLLNNANHCKTCGRRCMPLPNADAACGNGECTYQRCKLGFIDCNGDRTDGCETPCAPPNAIAKCGEDGECDYQRCEAGYEDCNEDREDGCETKGKCSP